MHTSIYAYKIYQTLVLYEEASSEMESWTLSCRPGIVCEVIRYMSCYYQVSINVHRIVYLNVKLLIWTITGAGLGLLPVLQNKPHAWNAIFIFGGQIRFKGIVK